MLECLEVEWILSAMDAAFDDNLRTRLRGLMTAAVPELTAAETFLARFVAEDLRDDDDEVLLMLL